MKKVIIGGVLIATLSGCATKTVPLTSSVGNAYRGKTITYAVHEKPSFSAMTADKAMFGAIGGVAMINKGNKIIRENNVPDPAATIGATLVNDLAIKYGLVVKQPTKRTSSTKTEQVASDYRNADLVLDVQTKNWGFAYFPMDWDNYRIMYGAKLKLIDTRTVTELASGSVSYDSKKSNGKHPSYGQLINNQAAGLKQELKKAQTHSIIDFRKRIL
ncbi:MAG: hypothetical protein KJN67_05340 [Pontiella sp.]|nr:hypothetical protein [Pontiella sp.]NNJ70749.1 hypothetical protein [Kiritimatiellales bacterium]